MGHVAHMEEIRDS